MKIGEAIKLFNSGINASENELRYVRNMVFEHVFELTPAEILINTNTKMQPEQEAKLKKIIVEINNGRPIQYILGETYFLDYKFFVNENVLIPRPETEELVMQVYSENKIRNRFKLIDIGTGSGCIAIALKSLFKNADITAVDISEEALRVARKNARENEVEVQFKKFNILDGSNHLNSKFDLIVSNPPYIPFKEKVLMDKHVIDFEPEIALFVPDNEPLLFYEAIAEFALKCLNRTGSVYAEINEGYAVELIKLYKRKGFRNVEVISDMQNKPRILKAQLL